VQVTAYLIPALFIFVLCYSLAKRHNAYQSFAEGASQALNLIFKVFPYLLTVMIAVEIFRQTGVSAGLAKLVSPALGVFGIPKELSELVLLRPLSGAGSLAILDNIYSVHGTDTYIGKCASVIYGSSETIFYVATIYFTGTKIKKLRYAIPLSLLATFVGVIVGCWMVRLL